MNVVGVGGHMLVTGGARSGKSAFAQAATEVHAMRGGLERVFVATAEAWDEEMRVRIAAHVAARGAGWRTIDAPFDLVSTLREHAGSGRILLVDCLTLWLSNCLLRGDNVQAAGDQLAASLAEALGPIVLVSNEVGCGIVPENALARRFRDAQGRLNQAVAATCEVVVLVAAGLPLALKGALPATTNSGV